MSSGDDPFPGHRRNNPNGSTPSAYVQRATTNDGRYRGYTGYPPEGATFAEKRDTFLDKAEVVFKRAVPRLPSAMAREARELVSPQNVIIFVGLVELSAAANLTPFGWVLDLGLLAAAGYAAGAKAGDALEKIMECVKLTGQARDIHDPRLDKAAQDLADAIIDIGGVALMLALLRKVSKGSSGGGGGAEADRALPQREAYRADPSNPARVVQKPAIESKPPVPKTEAPTQTGSTASAGKAAGKTVTVTAGKNVVTYKLAEDGSPISASGNLKEYFSGAKRGAAELKAQKDAAASGIAGDQGGHLVGHRFMLDQGDKNLFPQEGNFNMSAFKVLENDYARYTQAGHEVEFEHTLGDFDPVTGRPGSVTVNYDVIDKNGDLVSTYSQKFLNQPGQSYTRRAY